MQSSHGLPSGEDSKLLYSGVLHNGQLMELIVDTEVITHSPTLIYIWSPPSLAILCWTNVDGPASKLIDPGKVRSITSKRIFSLFFHK